MTPPVVDGFTWTETEAGLSLRSDALNRIPHVFTTRHLGFREAYREADEGRLAAHLRVPPSAIVWVTQVHGRTVRVVTPDDASRESPAEADAIVSTDPNRAIAVRTADCVPVLMADRSGQLVGAVHAGWRGSAIGTVGAAVEAMTAQGTAAADLLAAVGPSVGPCCYQVDDRVRAAFLGVTPDAVSWFTEDGPGHWRLDLWQATIDQLVTAGVPAGSITVSRLCTVDHPDICFSFRRDGAGAGRLVAAIRPSASGGDGPA